MNQPRWSNSNIDYGRKLLNSGLRGARSGREAFLDGKPFSPFLAESARNALKPAVLGLCIGVLGSSQGIRHKSGDRVFAYGFVGGAIGALKNIGKVRDEHWLERYPIDYA